MTGKDIIKLIKDHDLEDHHIHLQLNDFNFKSDEGGWGFDLKEFEMTGVDDIGHSDRIVKIGIKERD